MRDNVVCHITVDTKAVSVFAAARMGRNMITPDIVEHGRLSGSRCFYELSTGRGILSDTLLFGVTVLVVDAADVVHKTRCTGDDAPSRCCRSEKEAREHIAVLTERAASEQMSWADHPVKR